MATITTTEYLDSGTARTAGESMLADGGQLIIRTDTRWHVGSPASMTGTISLSTSGSTGGTITVDGTKVRWIAYTGAVGTVPAWGTQLVQGSVSGYILGFYSSLTSAPSTIGSSIPSSGFIKLREVTGGTFSAGASTAGVSLTLSGPDVPGWIEVVADASTTMVISGPNHLWDFNGDWFYLDNTSGTPGQIIQVPTNGGGANTRIIALQVETSPGSNTYDWWSGIPSASFLPATFAIDQRSKYFSQLTNGQVQIGNNGTNNVAYTPPAGCKVRIPNIFLRFATTAARASNTNATQATRPALTYNNGAGTVNLRNCICEWNLFTNVQNPTAVDITNSCVETACNITNPAKASKIKGACFAGNLASVPLTLSTIVQSFSLEDTYVYSNVSSANNISISTSSGLTISNLHSIIAVTRGSTSASTLTLSVCDNITIDGFKSKGSGYQVNNCTNISIKNVDYVDRLAGDTNTTQGMYVGKITSSSTIIADGLTFGHSGALTAVNPYAGIYTLANNLGNIKVRNGGSISNKLNCGTNAANYPGTVVLITGVQDNIKIQRIYLENIRTSLISNISFLKNSLIEHVYGTQSLNLAMPGGVNVIFRENGGGQTFTTGTVGSYGSHFASGFTSNTAGYLTVYASQPTSQTTDQAVATVTGLGSGFGGTCRAGLDKVGEYITWTTPNFIKGHTGFQNSAATISGQTTGNLTFQFSIDTGSGFGAFQTLNSTNLSAITVDPAIGFRMQFKVTCATASVDNNIDCITILTTSTLSAQSDNLYVLETVTLGFTNLVPGSEVRVYQGTDPATSVEIGGTESVGGTTFSFTHSAGGQAGTIAIFALGYQPIYLPYTFKTTDDSILIQQVVDRNYVNPV